MQTVIQQQQDFETKKIKLTTTTRKRGNVKGKKYRDFIDIFASILDTLSNQMVYQEKDKRFGRNYIGKYRLSGELLTLCAVRRRSNMGEAFMQRMDTLLKCGLISIDIIKWRNKSGSAKRRSAMITKKIVSLTDKGRRFLYVYREIRSLLSYPIL